MGITLDIQMSWLTTVTCSNMPPSVFELPGTLPGNCVPTSRSPVSGSASTGPYDCAIGMRKNIMAFGLASRSSSRGDRRRFPSSARAYSRASAASIKSSLTQTSVIDVIRSYFAGCRLWPVHHNSEGRLVNDWLHFAYAWHQHQESMNPVRHIRQ